MVLNSGKPENPSPSVKKSWLRRNFLSLVMSILVVGITIALFIFQDDIIKLGNYGYLGTFIISLLTNATIILPMPSILIIFPLGATFNPLYIGLAAGVGGAIGEMTAYVAGYSGSGIWHNNPNYLKIKAWLQKWGMLIVFLYSATPMPLDLMGLAAGNLRLPAWKFFVPCLPGKIIKYIVLAYAGYFGWEAFNKSESLKEALFMSGIVILGVIILLGLALLLERWDWKRARKK
ncbi:MAG: VTT domain-containing protein [Dehalococcoidales bacterium]|nr:VTT domain-containing protein [Dehalococcoidales bacterium]